MDAGEREVVTSAGIARMAGVGRAAVSNWRKRYPGFPKPVGGSPGGPTFDRGEVVRWLRESGKGDQLATAGHTDGGTLRVAAPLATAFDEAVSELFAAKSPPERSVAGLSGRELLARAMVALLPRSVVARGDTEDDTGSGSADDTRHGSGNDVTDGARLPVVLDPACGTGLLLLAAADRFGNRVRLVGQELTEGAARIAAFNLGGNADRAEYEVHTGDSLLNDQLSAYRGKAAAVVCEPPFDRPEWPVAELTTDPRWEFGIPAPRDGELVWVQHCYAQLRPYGVAVVAVSPRTCVQPSGEHVRAALIRSGVLRDVIALPAGLNGAGLCLWVLRRPGSAPDRSPVRLADLSGLAAPADVPLESAAWEQLLAAGDRTVVRAVDRLELLDEGASLLPARYLAPRGEASAADLARVAERLAGIYATVGRGFPRFHAPHAPASHESAPHPPASQSKSSSKTAVGRRSHVTLAELERAGALTIRARDDTPRAGDVLLRTLGRLPVVATGTAADSGVAQVVEIDPARLDPHFVAMFLRGDVAALPVANTLGAINRDDLRRCRIPRMPLVEQRAYGAAFAQLTELEQALARLSDLSAKVIGQTIDSLTSGAVAPDHVTLNEVTRDEVTRSEGDKRQ